MEVRRADLFLEHFMFASRWLTMPFYISLNAGIALLLVMFALIERIPACSPMALKINKASICDQ